MQHSLIHSFIHSFIYHWHQLLWDLWLIYFPFSETSICAFTFIQKYGFWNNMINTWQSTCCIYKQAHHPFQCKDYSIITFSNEWQYDSWIMNWNTYGEKQLWPNLIHYARIYLQRLTKDVKKKQSALLVSWLIFEPDTSQIWSSTTHCTKTSDITMMTIYNIQIHTWKSSLDYIFLLFSTNSIKVIAVLTPAHYGIIYNAHYVTTNSGFSHKLGLKIFFSQSPLSSNR